MCVDMIIIFTMMTIAMHVWNMDIITFMQTIRFSLLMTCQVKHKRGDLGQICHVCGQYTRKPFEPPFEPSSRLGTVQAWFKGSNGGSGVRGDKPFPRA